MGKQETLHNKTRDSVAREEENIRFNVTPRFARRQCLVALRVSSSLLDDQDEGAFVFTFDLSATEKEELKKKKKKKNIDENRSIQLLRLINDTKQKRNNHPTTTTMTTTMMMKVE